LIIHYLPSFINSIFNYSSLTISPLLSNSILTLTLTIMSHIINLSFNPLIHFTLNNHSFNSSILKIHLYAITFSFISSNQILPTILLYSSHASIHYYQFNPYFNNPYKVSKSPFNQIKLKLHFYPPIIYSKSLPTLLLYEYLISLSEYHLPLFFLFISKNQPLYLLHIQISISTTYLVYP
jgi:hypothetical protein